MPVAIRAASADDAALLARLHAECFAQSWDSGAFETLLRDGGTFALLAGAASDPHAFILIRIAADESEILSLGTLPAARCSGLARALLEAGCNEAHRRGAQRLFLEVADDNDAALALYRSFGFATVSRRRAYYSRDNGRTADAFILSAALPLVRRGAGVS